MGMPQKAWSEGDVMTTVPKNMVLLTREYYEQLAAAREREIDKLCEEAVARIEARKAAGVKQKSYSETEIYKGLEEKYGFKRIPNRI